MSRHTLPDGATPDPGITARSYDLWWPELAPKPSLIGSYYKRGLPWDEFELEYKRQLRTQAVSQKIGQLIALSQSDPVTVLCIEDQPAKCHRQLLLEHCLDLSPGLEIHID